MSIWNVPVAVPFHLEAVVKTHGWFQLAPFYWHEPQHQLRWVTAVDGKPRLITVEQLAKGEVLLSGSRLSPRQWENVQHRFHHVFNLELDLKPFYRLCKNDQTLQRVRRHGMGRIMRSESVYEDVFKSICGTNVQWNQAVKMVNSVAQLGPVIPGTKYRQFPDAATVLKAGEKYLLHNARVGYRSRYLLALCERMRAGDEEVRRVEAGSVQGAELLTFFTGFMGIGKITARYLAALYGYFGELAVDSMVYTYMARFHFNGQRPTEKQVQDHYAAFGEWRYLAYWMEFIINRGWLPSLS
jgi:3-methyladenine DNA glycosylase/8-oxoguanine DNA glycosylase